LVHIPPQQSAFEAQVSPFCWQNDGDAHEPLAGQKFEQQSPLFAQGLPLVRHEGLRVEQVPEVPQRPLQHWPLPEHDCPSATHAPIVHTPATQLPLQQSEA
jgi:hypothetical protein